jgi:hypothetical protein
MIVRTAARGMCRHPRATICRERAVSAKKIRELNDAFRTTMIGGRVMMTAGVDALPSDVKALVVRRVATFSDFNAEHDPHGEHDFGSFEVASRKIFFKLDYFDTGMEFGSEDPADLTKTTRGADDYARGRVLVRFPALLMLGGFI